MVLQHPPRKNPTLHRPHCFLSPLPPPLILLPQARPNWLPRRLRLPLRLLQTHLPRPPPHILSSLSPDLQSHPQVLRSAARFPGAHQNYDKSMHDLDWYEKRRVVGENSGNNKPLKLVLGTRCGCAAVVSAGLIWMGTVWWWLVKARRSTGELQQCGDAAMCSAGEESTSSRQKSIGVEEIVAEEELHWAWRRRRGELA
ncbi:hypothetical protein M0R45_025906 [Rubus argutus]|uniref:Transmembrane protein n=1 Tax=Rubus argutus TaxID=59490 RepID=A0AAW1WVX7_RUBAR